MDNPDIISYGRTTFTVASTAPQTSITVNEAARTGIRANQDITLIGAAVHETVTVSTVVGDVVTFAPATANSYVIGDEVWITSQVFQDTIDTRLVGSFLATIMTTGTAATGLSVTMFGTVLGMVGALSIGGFVGFAIRGVTPYTFPITLMAVFLFLMLFTIWGFVDVVVMDIIGMLLVLIAVYQIFWRF